MLRDGGTSGEGISVLAGSGCYSRFIGARDANALDAELRVLVDAAFRHRQHDFKERRSILYIRTGSGREVVVLLEAEKHLSDTDRALVEIFSSRLAVAFDNVILYEQLQEANARLEERVSQRTRDLTFANRRLAVQWARLQRANAFKSEILGTVAHDLKNPLGVILGRAEMLKEMTNSAASSPESVQAQIDHIRDAARRLTAMVDNLIADAMADALDIAIRREPVDLSILVQEIVATNQPLADGKDQIISVSTAPAHNVMCDIDRMREALDNLLSNAIKYSPIGGHIEVMVTRENGQTAIRVRDEGAGLSPEDMSRLFGRFQRLSAKPTAGENSTGLGLSIVKRIVELHGGSVRAESAGPGRGTTFHMTLPES